MASSDSHIDRTSWKLTPYGEEHRTACIAIFDSNLPEYVADYERELFTSFVDKGACPYFVVEATGGEIIACGGYAVTDGEARMCWGLVRRDLHRRGVGRFLLVSRLLRIHEECGDIRVTLDTSHKTSAFFERFGFHVLERIEDGYRPGLHKLEMALTLDKQTADGLRHE